MKKLVLIPLLAAVATLVPAASVFGGANTTGVDVRDLVGERWHAVVKNQNGTGGGCDANGVCSVKGNWITISTEGATFDVAMDWQVVPPPADQENPVLNQWMLWNGDYFKYPTTADFIRQFVRSDALLATSTLGNAVASTRAPSLQPLVSCTKHDPIGSLSRWPYINLARHWWGYTGCDDPRLAPNMREWRRRSWYGRSGPGMRGAPISAVGRTWLSPLGVRVLGYREHDGKIAMVPQVACLKTRGEMSKGEDG